jgi:hypothetical protein
MRNGSFFVIPVDKKVFFPNTIQEPNALEKLLSAIYQKIDKETGGS